MPDNGNLDHTLYRFEDSLVPKQWSAFNIELLPFTFGHLILLERIGNQVVSKEEAQYTGADGILNIFTAVILCGVPYEQGLYLLNNPMDFKKVIDQFSYNLVLNMSSHKSWKWYIRCCWWLISNQNKYLNWLSQPFKKYIHSWAFKGKTNFCLLKEINRFKLYMAYYMEMPLYTLNKPPKARSASGTDWKSNIFKIFKKEYTESEILNMNMKKIWTEWTSFAETEDIITVINRYEYNQLQEIAKNKEKVAV